MLPPKEPDATNERLEEAEGASAAKQDAPETRGPAKAEDAGRKGGKLTFEQAVAHIGGVENLVSEHGHHLIKLNAHQYLWKYPNKTTWCTACGRPIEGFIGNHGRMYACPLCGTRAEFRYEAKGHGRVYDEFYLYEWRRSVLDDEVIVLTGAVVYRNSTHELPHTAPLKIDANAIYVFRPGEAATVYKRRWYWGHDDGTWELKKEVHPEHTKWGCKPMDIVMDHMEFRRAIEGTRIGKLFDLLREESGRWQDLELTAIANCARRPWLEYLYKSGQRYLAGQLMREERVGRDIVPRLKARKPRELLGLTEGQWFEIRRDGLSLTIEALKTLRAMMKLDIGAVKVAEALRLSRIGTAHWHIVCEMLPDPRGYGPRICDRLAQVPDKARRKILRRILGDFRHATEWKDYYSQLARLGEVPMAGDAFAPEADMALILPKDLHAMHQRMTDRENAIILEKRMKALAEQQTALEKRLEKLRKEFTFQACGLVLRPYESCEEVVKEGQRLHICIGGYAENYAQGSTIICCLRKADAPDVSWRAVEFSARTGKLVQDRGAYNDGRGGIPEDTKELLRRFWAAFDERRKTDKTKERASA